MGVDIGVSWGRGAAELVPTGLKVDPSWARQPVAAKTPPFTPSHEQTFDFVAASLTAPGVRLDFYHTSHGVMLNKSLHDMPGPPNLPGGYSPLCDDRYNGQQCPA
jgi:hypothetical protein